MELTEMYSRMGLNNADHDLAERTEDEMIAFMIK